MADAKTSSKNTLTRGKAILIVVLAVVLVAILYIQFGGGEKLADKPVNYRPPRPAVAVQSANSPANSITPAIAKTPSNTPSGKDTNATAAMSIDVAQWKSPKLETVTEYDPFALPPSFPQLPKSALAGPNSAADGLIAAAAADEAKKEAEAVEQRHLQLEELKQRGVHVIVGEGDQFVAWIGDRKLHVGDEINGFTVTAIDPDGGVSIVEKKESP